MHDTKTQLSKATIILHWIVALTIIFLLFIGMKMTMGEEPIFSLYPIHKSIGTLILMVILIRVYWRIINGWLKPVQQPNKVEHTIARTVQWILITASVLMPISGIMMSAFGGYGVSVFGLELFASNFVEGKAVAINGGMAHFAHTMHEILGPVLIITVVLHFLGALKHHFVTKDKTLTRMLGKK